MLLQIAAKRSLELGSATAALEHMAADRSVEHLFAVDLDLLTTAEQELLRTLADTGAGSAGDPAAPRLLRLGLVRNDQPDGGLSLPNRLLAGWLRQLR